MDRKEKENEEQETEERGKNSKEDEISLKSGRYEEKEEEK